MSAARDSVFDALKARIADISGPGLTMVAIDGVDGAGKTMFADALAAHLEADEITAVRTGIDSFHNPRAIRHRRGKDSPEGFFRDSYNLDALRTQLLFPARIGLPFHTAIFDHRTDRAVAVNPLVVPLPAVLIFDGLFLHRPELRDEWDLSVFLDVPFEVSYARMAKRDRSDPNPMALSNRRYHQGQQLYFAECQPQKSADVLVDYSDLETPRIARG
ncbi:MAG: uridine kinase [Devosia sp.]